MRLCTVTLVAGPPGCTRQKLPPGCLSSRKQPPLQLLIASLHGGSGQCNSCNALPVELLQCTATLPGGRLLSPPSPQARPCPPAGARHRPHAELLRGKRRDRDLHRPTEALRSQAALRGPPPKGHEHRITRPPPHWPRRGLPWACPRRSPSRSRGPRAHTAPGSRRGCTREYTSSAPSAARRTRPRPPQ